MDKIVELKQWFSIAKEDLDVAKFLTFQCYWACVLI